MSHRFALGQDGREAKIVYEVVDSGDFRYYFHREEKCDSLECAKAIEPAKWATRRTIEPRIVWADTGEPVEWEFPL